MKKEKEENRPHANINSPLLADTPEARMEQYEAAVQVIDRFENQYNTYEVGLTKVTVWKDENGTVHRIEEELSREEKAGLERARAVKLEYEENHMDEYLDRNWGLTPYVGECRGLPDERQALGEIRAVREAKLERAFDRLTRFELRAVPDLTVRGGDGEFTVLSETDGKISRTAAPVPANELAELDEATAFINETYWTDSDLLDEVETRVLQDAMDRIGEARPADRDTIERLQYVRDLEDSMSLTFGSYDEAVQFERDESDELER